MPVSKPSSPVGKTDRQGRGKSWTRWLSVECHSADAAACMHALLLGATAKRLETAAGRPLVASDIVRLCIMALYHDSGKFMKGFADKLMGSTALSGGHCAAPLRVLSELPTGSETDEGSALAEAMGWNSMLPWFGGFQPCCDALTILYSHHGGCRPRPPLPGAAEGQLGRTVLDHHPAQGMRRLQDAARTLFPRAWDETAPPLPTAPAFWNAFLGLLMIADWMASTNVPDRPGSHHFPLDGDTSSIIERYRKSVGTATVMLRDMGFHGCLPRGADAPAPEAALEGKFPRHIQSRMVQLSVSCREIGLQAPTAEGKTEAALMRFLLLHAAGEVDGMYFAVPTRSAGSALHRRIRGIIERIAPGWPTVVRAVPGGPGTGEPSMGGSDSENPPRPNWASEGRDMSRALAAGIAVGTIDQLLLSGLRIYGAHGRAAATVRLFLVIDEVHASDPYMLSALKGVLERHRAVGGHFLIMSATLGSHALAELMRAPLLSCAQACLVPYPSVTVSGPAATTTQAIDADPRRARTVRTEIVSRHDIVARVGAAVRTGARVLIIRSTVRDARATQLALEADGIPTLTVASRTGSAGVAHHSRFAAVDRTVLDDAVEGALKREAHWSPGREGVAVVSTQTCEQSLDIDADLLVTDPCPADVLIQRLGRLHRSVAHRPPGFDEPTCLVINAGPLERYLNDDGTIRLPSRQAPGFAFVYSNLVSISETMRWVARGYLSMPGDCRAMVEEATHPDHLREVAAGLGQQWTALWERLYRKDGDASARGVRNALKWGLLPLHKENVLLEDEDGVRTRLGADRLTAQVEFTSFLGNRICSLDLKPGDVGKDWNGLLRVVSQGPDSTRLEANGKTFVYDRLGLRHAEE